MSNKRLTDEEILNNKTDALMKIVNDRCYYYRNNIHRAAEDLIGLHLKLFQKILLFAMNEYYNVYTIASRGISKTWSLGLFATLRCWLWPGTKVVVMGPTQKQGREVLLKITDDFMQRSSLLRSEISKVSIGQNDSAIYFKNGSWIRVATASDTGRGLRSNIVISNCLAI